MLRGDISNQKAVVVAIDLDGIISPPDSGWRRMFIDFLARFAWLDWRLKRVTFYWYTVDISAQKLAYQLTNMGLVTYVVVRHRHTLGLARAIQYVLDGGASESPYPDFPFVMFLPISSITLHEQANDIRKQCNLHEVHRFFTKDADLATVLPAGLCRHISYWNDVFVHL